MKIATFMATMSVCTAMLAQTNVWPLWPDKAPGALGTEEKDIPTLTVFLPEPSQASGSAMVICPGGGYAHLARHEGEDYARFLNEQGIAGFVLKYRLGSGGYRHPIILGDAARAVRWVRAHADQWNIDPQRVGIMGSSAGGHLASTLLTHFDAGDPNASDPVEKQSSRPNLGILCYPVISMMDTSTHSGSRRNLLGPDPSEEARREVSSELQVTADTPPCFIWHTWEDAGVPVENSLMFATSLRKAKVPFDLHIYEKGPHGLGLGTRDWDPQKRHPWAADCAYWLKGRGWTKP